MVVKITAKRQVTFPAAVLEALGVGPGDRLELHEGPDGFLLRPQRIDFPVWRHCATRSGAIRAHSTWKSSGTSLMTPRFGIDTSVLVRLLTGRPEDTYTACRNALQVLIEERGARIFASNMVIGEAYIAVQHHYGVAKEDARDALLTVLKSGMVSPLHGRSVLAAITSRSGAGLLDRLIADDYRRAELVTLTLDRKMAALPAAEPLLSRGHPAHGGGPSPP